MNRGAVTAARGQLELPVTSTAVRVQSKAERPWHARATSDLTSMSAAGGAEPVARQPVDAGKAERAQAEQRAGVQTHAARGAAVAVPITQQPAAGGCGWPVAVAQRWYWY